MLQIVEHQLDRIRAISRYHREIKKIQDPRRKEIWSQVTLTKEQMEEIDGIYRKNYGKKIPYTWHRYFTAYTGSFDAGYFPEHLFIPRFEFFMNQRQYERVLGDKNLAPLICAKADGVVYPHIYLSRCNGIFRDENMKLITRERACDILSNIGEVFLKPSVDSCSGNNCRLLQFHNGLCEIGGGGVVKNIQQILEMYGNDFMVSEKIICSEDIRKIYPQSVNTFRVISYLWDNKVCHVPALMRIGRGGSVVDNAHAGGIFIGVTEDGTLKKNAFTEFHEVFAKHPDSGIVFDGYKIHNFSKVLSAVETLHVRIPQVRVINWDFTINQENEAVLIEANIGGGSVWLSEMANGMGPFGDNLESILQWLRYQEQVWHI
jgi:hypothetical protein